MPTSLMLRRPKLAATTSVPASTSASQSLLHLQQLFGDDVVRYGIPFHSYDTTVENINPLGHKAITCELSTLWLLFSNLAGHWRHCHSIALVVVWCANTVGGPLITAIECDAFDQFVGLNWLMLMCWGLNGVDKWREEESAKEKLLHERRRRNGLVYKKLI